MSGSNIGLFAFHIIYKISTERPAMKDVPSLGRQFANHITAHTPDFCTSSPGKRKENIYKNSHYACCKIYQPILGTKKAVLNEKTLVKGKKKSPKLHL